MGRAQSKKDLLTGAAEKFEKMWALIDSMSDEELGTAFDFADDEKKKEAHWKRDKNLRDILVHLYEWHGLLLKWIHSNQSGDKKPFLPSPYNWKTYGDMNIEIWKKHQETPLETSKNMVKNSHKEVMNLLETFSNEELFTKGIFNWTGTTTLGSYCVSATASHYEWAIKKLKAHIKKCKMNK